MIASPQRAQRRGRPAPRYAPPPQQPAPGAVIAYDHGAVFPLTGRPGNVVEDVINISPEGAFVAVAIGYGFEEDRGRSIGVALTAAQRRVRRAGLAVPVVVPGEITLGQIPPAALIEGLRVNPRFAPLVFESEPDAVRAVRRAVPRSRKLANRAISAADVSGPGEDLLLQRLQPPAEISFLFSLVDSACGRELQDEPTHNLASLGKSNGERPFRPLAQPVTFLPRSTIRLQIIERSEGVRGTLFIVLYGYKLLGAGCPEPVMRSLRGTPACPTETLGRPSARIIPFDYVAQLPLTGRAGHLVEDEIHVNVDGGFVATALGYGLEVDSGDVPLQTQPGPVDLSQVRLQDFPADALADGFRIRPSFLRVAFRDDGQLATVSADLANRMFESLNRPEDVSFRYTIFDSGRGVELQNRPLHNVAGLGIANGDRPFKKFARPMTFLPRSTIRINVEEHFGRGVLFLVFQGYKLLETPTPGGRP